MKHWIKVLAAVVLVACSGGKSTAPAAPDVTGSWTGSVGGIPLSLQLNQTTGNVSGGGTLGSGSSLFALTSTGTMTGSTLSITNTSGLHPSFNITATLSGKNLNGTANGSGFVADAVILTKP
jgi:hypothetical protein